MNIQDAATLDPAAFDAALGLRQQIDRRIDPQLPPTTAPELRALFTDDRTELADHYKCVAFDNGPDGQVRAIGIGHIEVTNDPANPTFAALETETAESAGDLSASDNEACQLAMLAWSLDRAEERGRTSILLWGHLEASTAELWPRLGAPRKYTERYSDVRLDEVDAELMASWIERRHERADDVRLVAWDVRCPDEWLAQYAAVLNGLHDMPLDEIDVEHTDYTGDKMRREEDAYAALGRRAKTLMAVSSDGVGMGLTTVMVYEHRPNASWQWATVVLDTFRNRGIGRWLKAEMWRTLRAEYPDMVRLRTGNAESNAPMLAINVAMGYRPANVHGAWQTDIATLRAGIAKLS